MLFVRSVAQTCAEDRANKVEKITDCHLFTSCGIRRSVTDKFLYASFPIGNESK